MDEGKLISDIESAQGALESCQRKYTAALGTLREVETNLDRARDDLATQLEEELKAKELVKSLGLNVLAVDEGSALEPLTLEHDSLRTDLESATLLADKAKTALGEAQAAVAFMRDMHNERLVHAARQAAETTRRVEEHHRVLQELPIDLRPTSITTESMVDKASQIETIIRDAGVVQRRLSQAEKAAADARTNVARIKVRLATEVATPISTIVNGLNSRNARVHELCAAIGEAEGGPAPSTPSDLDPFDEPSVLAIQATAMTSRHSAVELLATDLRSRLRNLYVEIERTCASLVAEVHCANVDDLRAKSGSAQTELDHASANVRKLEEDVATTANLDTFLAVAEPFIANLAILGEALRDKQFIGYLVKTRETQLLGEATRRLRSITNGRFGFGENFSIVNIASGEQRTPDTLSGGERFQAALALALALVEITTRGGGQLNAIFIDEGFGSLDANALDDALATLNKIAGSGKLVALISHLSQVAENVDEVLRVTKSETQGSRIERLALEELDRLLADDERSGLTG